MKNVGQKGFGVIESLLILVIVGIIGGTGFYVYKANQDSNKEQSESYIAKQDKKEQKPKEDDPTKDWKAFSSVEGKFSLKHPANWVTAVQPEFCNKGLILLGIDKNSVGSCGSENFGQIAVYSNDGDLKSEMEFKISNYPDLKTEEITLNGIKGKKQTGTYQATGEGIGPENGDKQIAYTFFTNNKTYQATYSSGVSVKYPDARTDFEQMIEKTLKFSP